MPSLTARVVRRAVRATMKPLPADSRFVAELRDQIGGRPPPSLLGRRVGQRVLAAGELDGVAGEWVGVPAATRHILYLHGGYYVAGGPPTYRNLAARLAAGLDADVLLPDYRLAPEHPYPAAVDDGIAAYRALLATGVDPSTAAIAGDSAGGGLTLAVLLRAKAEGVALPAGAVLLSPWTDLTCSGESIDGNDAADDVLWAASLRAAAAHYAGTSDPALPELSPLFGDLSGLPPLFVTVDESEALLDDSLRLTERARAAGTSVELRRTTGLFHIWPVTVPYVREARQTVAEIVAFLDRTLA